MIDAPRRGRALEPLAAIVFLVGLAGVMSNRVPFWDGMTALMVVTAAVCGWRLKYAGVRPFAPNLFDTLLGVGLGVATWGALRILWRPLLAYVPDVAGGLTLVGAFAAGEPLVWAAASMGAIALAEELVWRRYLTWRLAALLRLGPYAVASISACLYAGMHLWSGQVFLALPALAFGMAWGWLSAWRRSPWASMVWHLCFDALVFLVAPPPMPLSPGI